MDPAHGREPRSHVPLCVRGGDTFHVKRPYGSVARGRRYSTERRAQTLRRSAQGWVLRVHREGPAKREGPRSALGEATPRGPSAPPGGERRGKETALCVTMPSRSPGAPQQPLVGDSSRLGDVSRETSRVSQGRASSASRSQRRYLGPSPSSPQTIGVSSG